MNATFDHPIPPEELASTAADTLEEILAQLPIRAEGKPREFLITAHANNILMLARDVIYLQAKSRDYSTPVIARAMLESLFKLAVAIKDPDLAARKVLLEIEWDQIQAESPGADRKELAKIRQKPIYSSIGQLIGQLSVRWNFPESEYLSDTQQFSTWRWAKDGGMSEFYKRRYAELSLYSHAMVTSFVVGPMPSFVLAVVVLCLIESIEHISRRYQQHISKELAEQRIRLRKVFDGYHESGEYERLFKKAALRRSTPRPQRPKDKFKDN